MRPRIYDELYGYLALQPDEAYILDTPVVQRLRRIKQLSLADYVYPGATHTRLSHSLGVMHLAGRIASSLSRQGLLSPDLVGLVRIAGLLHDIGHLPLSHCLEQLLGRGAHEELTAYMVRFNPQLREAISLSCYEPVEVEAVLLGRHRDVPASILHGDVDADRLDYLPRDALHTGVAYGLIDQARLLDTLTMAEGVLAVNWKGMQALENFYLARLHMYQAVYYHKTIIGYEIYMAEIVKEIAQLDPEISILTSINQLKRVARTDEISTLDDYWLATKIYTALKSRETPERLKKMIRNLLNRRGPKTVYEKILLTDQPREALQTAQEELCSILETLRSHGIENIYPYKTIITIVNDETSPPIITRDGGIQHITEAPTILRHIPRHIIIARVYTEHEEAKKAKQILHTTTKHNQGQKPPTP